MAPSLSPTDLLYSLDVISCPRLWNVSASSVHCHIERSSFSSVQLGNVQELAYRPELVRQSSLWVGGRYPLRGPSHGAQMKSPESTPTGPRKRGWVHSKEAVFWRHVKPYPLQQACCLRTITVSLSKVYIILLSSLTLYFIFYCLCFNMSPHILTQQTSVNPFRWPHHTTRGN